MTTEVAALGKYQLMPVMTPEQYQDLKNNIRKHGVKVPIEFDEQGAILDGHHRSQAWSELIEEGVDLPMFPRIDRHFATEEDKIEHVITVNVNRRHLTPEQRRQLAFQLRKPPFSYTHKRIGQLLGVSDKTVWYDLDELTDAEKAEIENTVIETSNGVLRSATNARFVFVSGDKQEKQASRQITGAQAQEATETPAEVLNKKWNVQTGQIWRIPSKSAPDREHRLMCADSTSVYGVDTLFNYVNGSIALAQLVWTDPPYGVNYVGKTEDALTLEADNETGLELLLKRVLMITQQHVEPGSPFYMCHPPGPISWIFGDVLRALGWRMHETLVWVKDSMVLGHSDYHLKHEPIYYGWLPGGDGRPGRGSHEGSKWYGDDSQVSVFEIARPKRSEVHPTMKPTALIVKHILNSSGWKDIVYDPFVGSGSTAAAAEQTGRVCFGVDVKPENIAISLQRLADMGLTPELAG